MSLVLAKYIAKMGIEVDYYLITDLLRDKGAVPGFEYTNASKKLGIYQLKQTDIPEIYNDSKGLPVRYYLLRILSYSQKLFFANKWIFITCSHYSYFQKNTSRNNCTPICYK